ETNPRELTQKFFAEFFWNPILFLCEKQGDAKEKGFTAAIRLARRRGFTPGPSFTFGEFAILRGQYLNFMRCTARALSGHRHRCRIAKCLLMTRSGLCSWSRRDGLSAMADWERQGSFGCADYHHVHNRDAACRVRNQTASATTSDEWGT